MYSSTKIQLDSRGFYFNVNSPWIRASFDSAYSDYVQTYTDDEFKADVFLRYGKHYGPKDHLDEMMDNENKRRFGCLVSDVYDDIVSYVGSLDYAHYLMINDLQPLDVYRGG